MPRALHNLQMHTFPQLIRHILPHRLGQHAVARADQKRALARIPGHAGAHIVLMQRPHTPAEAIQTVRLDEVLDVREARGQLGVGVGLGHEPAAGGDFSEFLADEGLARGAGVALALGEGDALVPGAGVAGRREGVGVAGDEARDAGRVG